jgi:hypothetical protein
LRLRDCQLPEHAGDLELLAQALPAFLSQARQLLSNGRSNPDRDEHS